MILDASVVQSGSPTTFRNVENSDDQASAATAVLVDYFQFIDSPTFQVLVHCRKRERLAGVRVSAVR